MMESVRDVREWVERWLSDPLRNRLAPDREEAVWRKPLVGAARGDDPLFMDIAAMIGDFHWTPRQAWRLAFPEEEAEAEELAVIAWILPQSDATRREQAREKRMPGLRWSQARHFGEQCNQRLRRELAAMLTQAGHPAAAPVELPQWRRETSPAFGYASTWSERHAAHVCGLGTFGLSDGLITPLGKAVRVGSVVTRLNVAPAERPYADHRAWCLHFATGSCGICARRCPAGAISKAGHDKVRCKTYIRGTTAPFVEEHQLGIRVSSCGLCQAGVPCASGIPVPGADPGEPD